MNKVYARFRETKILGEKQPSFHLKKRARDKCYFISPCKDLQSADNMGKITTTY